MSQYWYCDYYVIYDIMGGTKNIVGKFNAGFIVADFNKLQYIF